MQRVEVAQAAQFWWPQQVAWRGAHLLAMVALARIHRMTGMVRAAAAAVG